MSYIDKEKAIAYVEEQYRLFKNDEEKQAIVEGCVEALKFTPTADVEEVRHGYWKKVSEKYPRYVCTACNHLFNNHGYKYCPNCGAKMDAEMSEK